MSEPQRMIGGGYVAPTLFRDGRPDPDQFCRFVGSTRPWCVIHSDWWEGEGRCGSYRPVDRTEAATTAREEPTGPDYEQMRKDRGWPTPNHMRSTADALDTLTAARYGDVLRWFADLADAALDARLAAADGEEPE